MATKSNDPRILVCVVSGTKFPYTGRGRPPKFCPEVKAEMLKANAVKARANAKAKRLAQRVAKAA